VFLEKNVTLGPDYYIGISYRYNKGNTNLTITKIFDESEGGNNFNTNLTEGDIVTKINGVSINKDNGDTLEYALTFIGLKNLTLSTDTENHTLNVDVIGVYIGIKSYSYFMHKNDVAKFLTSFWPIFWLTELLMLFMIAFSITFFNMLPLPIFDGDRIVKELINWGIGEDYKSLKKKKDKFIFKIDEKNYELSEYRVDKINSIEIIMDDESKFSNSSRITLAEDKYELFDKIGDGFKDTVSLNLPEQKKLPEGSRIEISYDHWYDEKRKIKRRIMNSIRLITFIFVLGTFILSFIKFGDILFWI
jgi:membrane-associated protease RseP (regulator of RpoE activity)